MSQKRGSEKLKEPQFGYPCYMALQEAIARFLAVGSYCVVISYCKILSTGPRPTLEWSMWPSGRKVCPPLVYTIVGLSKMFCKESFLSVVIKLVGFTMLSLLPFAFSNQTNQINNRALEQKVGGQRFKMSFTL